MIKLMICGPDAGPDRDTMDQALMRALKPVFGKVQTEWGGRPTNGRPVIACVDVPPEQMREFARIVREALGANCTIRLTATF